MSVGGAWLSVAWALALEARALQSGALVLGVLVCRSVGSAWPLAVPVYRSAGLAYLRSQPGPGRSAAR